jgi:uncharacterized delta-60 repeat protein
MTFKSRIVWLLAVALVSSTALARAQGTSGQLDLTFNPGPLTRGGDIANGTFLYAVAVQPDGKILVGGDFDQVNYVDRPILVRFNPDGSLDATFNSALRLAPADSYYASPYDIVLQPDGRILVAGEFDINGEHKYLARLNADGSIDASFNANVNALIYRIVLQPDGKIIIGSNSLQTVDGVAVNYLARLNPDGSLETPLGAVTYANTIVFAIALQPDGKIIVGGSSYLIRLNADGTLDPTFMPPDMSFMTVYAVALQRDGRILFGGASRSTGGGPFLSRINANGSADAAFNPLVGGGSVVWTILEDPDGKILIGGEFGRVNGIGRGDFARLNSDGTLDAFQPEPYDGADWNVEDIALEADGDVLIVGSFQYFYDAVLDPLTRTGVARILVSGSPDRQATTTTLSSSLNPSASGQQVTFTAAVTGATPTGTVTFFDGASPLGAPVALAAGSASLSVSSLSAGSHSITARYSGDANNAESTSSPLTQQVNASLPVVTLISSKNPSAPGEAITLSGTLPVGATGTVTVLDGATSLGNATVASGAFALTVSTLAKGTHSLKAHYNGDANNLSADSSVLTQVVDSAPAIGPIADQTVAWGSTIDISAVTSDGDGDQLTLSLIGAPAGASLDASGRFTWTPTNAQIGIHSLTIQVTDGTLTASEPFSVTVTKRTSSLSYTGQTTGAGSVELRANLQDQVNAAVVGRLVTFSIGTQSATATTDASGNAVTMLTLNQAAGIVSGSASFAGDAAYGAASQAPFNFRIDASPVVSPIAAQTIPWGRTLTFFVDAADPDGAALTFTLLNAPAGVSLSGVSPTRARIDWTPTPAQVGPASITIGASDGLSVTPVIVSVDVLKHATSVVQIGPGAGGIGPLRLTGTLVDSVAGTPIAGRTLAFVLGSQPAGAPTDASGVATASLTLAQAPGTVTLVVSFGGDSLYAASQASRPFEIFVDTDGDGLRDEWETNGVDVNGDGIIDLNLRAMGANPMRKDVFIEVDWMIKPQACVWLVCWTNGGVLQPQKVVLDALIAGFAAAPVTNPDGSTGISLHVDGGPTTVMNPITGEPWGPFSRATAVPYDDALGSADAAGNYDWTEFEAVKQAFLEPSRRSVFHYVVYANTIGGVAAGGISRGIPAADFILAAGDPSWNGGLTATQERSLFMHEFGHNLSLHHGGADDLNYKPNYHSVLNYLWSLVGLPPDSRADYSDVLEPAIDEAAAGDVNGDGRIDTLLGFRDWPSVVFNGGGIGDLQARPAPVTTPIDQINADDLRARGAYARAGDGLLQFEGPSVLALNSGLHDLIVAARNISDAPAEYTITAESALFAGPLSSSASLPANTAVNVTLAVDTAGLVPGEYIVVFTLRSAAGELLHRQLGKIVVVDLSVPDNQQAAREALDALAALPPDSGLDPSVKDQITAMFEPIGPSWTADVQVTGRTAFDDVYRIEEPVIPRNPGRITVESLAGAPVCEITLLRAGKAATGTVRLQRPSGEIFEAPIAGKWNDTTRVFEGTWFDGRRTGGSIAFRLRQP